MTIPMVINLRGKAYDLNETPLVMGILNHTPDSFYAGSRIQGETAIRQRIQDILTEGANIIDVGGYSTRPDAPEVSAEQEWQRVAEVLKIIRTEAPNAVVSVDTFRAEVARRAVTEFEADIINDVSGGLLDNAMYDTIAQLQVPYILMHMRGTPQTMQQLTQYDGNVTDQVIQELLPPLNTLQEKGVTDIILDPGFGFSKDMEQNYELMAELKKFTALKLPLLVGVSRKSMIYKLLDATPADALNGTTVLNTYSLLQGAHILRVHDVWAASEAVKIVTQLRKNTPTQK